MKAVGPTRNGPVEPLPQFARGVGNMASWLATITPSAIAAPAKAPVAVSAIALFDPLSIMPILKRPHA